MNFLTQMCIYLIIFCLVCRRIIVFHFLIPVVVIIKLIKTIANLGECREEEWFRRVTHGCNCLVWGVRNKELFNFLWMDVRCRLSNRILLCLEILNWATIWRLISIFRHLLIKIYWCRRILWENRFHFNC